MSHELAGKLSNSEFFDWLDKNRDWLKEEIRKSVRSNNFSAIEIPTGYTENSLANTVHDWVNQGYELPSIREVTEFCTMLLEMLPDLKDSSLNQIRKKHGDNVADTVKNLREFGTPKFGETEKAAERFLTYVREEDLPPGMRIPKRKRD